MEIALCVSERKSRACRKQPEKKRGKALITVVFLSAIVGIITSLWMINHNKETSLITWIIPKPTLISLFRLDYQRTSVDEECCSKMKHLAAAVFHAEKALRGTLRVRRTLMLTPQTNQIKTWRSMDRSYIEGVMVSRGENTEEWRSWTTIWRVIPLWRESPPPNTVLNTKRPIPADCWPFSGSTGELIFDLPSPMQVTRISIEHVHPDAALSAPRLFQLHGILSNGTWIKAVYGEYKHNGPIKQYYLNLHKDLPVERLIFRVLSNHGNPRYTCIYRVLLYSMSSKLSLN